MNKSARALFLTSKIFIILAIFLTPVFWLSEKLIQSLEWQKLFLLSFFTLAALLFWAIRIILEKEFIFRRTSLDLPVLFLWLGGTVSTVFSIDRAQSLLGPSQNPMIGFWGVSLFAILFFLVTNHFQSSGALISLFKFFIGSALLVFVLFFAALFLPQQLFGFLPPVPLVSISVGEFWIFTAIAIVLSLSLLLSRENKFYNTAFLGTALFVGTLTLFILNFRMFWLGLALALGVMIIFSFAGKDKIKSFWLFTLFAFLALSFLFAILGKPRLTESQLLSEFNLSNTFSRQIVGQALTADVKSFILGWGPATFGHAFSKYRPESLNLSAIWNLRFNQPSSMFFYILHSGGVAGMAAAGILVLLAAFLSLKVLFAREHRRIWDYFIPWHKIERGENLLLFGGVASALALVIFSAFFHVFSTVLLLASCVLFAALAVLYEELSGHKGLLTVSVSVRKSAKQAFLIPLITTAVFGLIIIFSAYLARFAAAEFAYTRALSAVAEQNFSAGTERLQAAIRLNPYDYESRVALAKAYIAQAVVEYNQGNVTPERVVQLVSLAVNSAQDAVKLSPKQAIVWDTLASIYENSRPLSAEALNLEIDALLKLRELEQANPIAAFRLAAAKLALGQSAEAKRLFEEATKLKPDYVDAHMALARLFEGDGNKDEAVAHATLGAQLAPDDPEILFELGRMLFNRSQANDWNLSESIFSKVLTINPNHKNALYGLGYLWERRGNLTEAQKYYRRLLILEPTNTEVRRRLNEILNK